MIDRIGAVALAAGLSGSLLVNATQAQTVAEFYKGSVISLYVGSGVGGGFDSYARIFAPHFRRHIPGTPAIVIKNMPGAAGLPR